jgi:hypothetical protein
MNSKEKKMQIWNLDTILEYIGKNGAEIGEDNDGQIVIYTNLFENLAGVLVPFPEKSNVVDIEQWKKSKGDENHWEPVA